MGVIMDKASLQACMESNVVNFISSLPFDCAVGPTSLPLVASSALSGSRTSWDPQTQKSWSR